MSGDTMNITLAATKERPLLRFAFGAALIMALALMIGSSLAYIIPLLALSFLRPGAPAPTLRSGLTFVGVVALTTGAGLFFTQYFYEYRLFFLPVLALLLLWIYYTDVLSPSVKLFLLISFLAMPVPMEGMSVALWAFALNRTLVGGAFFTMVMVMTVWALFPDRETVAVKAQGAGGAPPQQRLSRAARVLLITFPVVLAFIFFQWSDALLVLLYIVILALLPSGVKAGMGMVLANLLGGAATLVVYGLLLVAPNLFFFLLLYLAAALLFGQQIFSGKPAAQLYQTAFSAFTLLIGGVVMGEETTGIGTRIVQVFTAVVYVVAADAFLEKVAALPLVQRISRKGKRNLTTSSGA